MQVGMDDLDIVFRLERQFSVKLKLAALGPHFCRRTPPDLSAGELHDWVVAQCVAQGKPVPHSSWRRVKVVLLDAIAARPSTVRRDSLLRADLGMS